VNDLNRYFELVKLRLHQLLSTNSQEIKRILNRAGLHYLFAFKHVLFFPLFDNLPHFVRKHIAPLVKLFFGLVVFAQVWVIVAKQVEVLDKLVKQLLLRVSSLEEYQEFLLDACLCLE
jgi:hypothetical protein